MPVVIIDNNLIKCDKNSKQSSNEASNNLGQNIGSLILLLDLSQVSSNVIIKE